MGTAVAQSTSTGTIVGTVTDQSGAILPAATVNLTNTGTNVTQKTATNNAGHYVFVNVDPGTYNIKISKQGFQTANVLNQAVEVGKQLTEDVTLNVGAVSQEVTVETTGTELQTLNSTVGNTVTGVALDSMPTLGRDVSTFVELQPGVSPDGSVAGTVVDQSSFQLDGGQNTNDMDGSMSVYTTSFASDPTSGAASTGAKSLVNQSAGVAAGPTGVMPTPVDSVEEFKVNTANQTADFNSSSGAQVQIVTKRGTNTLHGSVYEYYLDNNFNANSWDNNLTGTPNPSYHYSRFGVALGGPIIPKDILGGKTYLFGNYEGFRWPDSTTIERAVPSANMRNGILQDSSGNIYNLNTLDPRGIGIDPTVKAFWNKYMPLPNDPGCGSTLAGNIRCDGVNVVGYKANISVPQSSNFGVVRLDHDFSSKLHFNTSYHYFHLTKATIDQTDIGGFFSGDTLGVPAALSNRPQVPWFVVAGLTANVSSNVTNDFHYSYLRNYWAWNTHGGPAQISGLGAAIEPLGESQLASLVPYNVNAQQARTRFWDGQDNYFRDDVTMLHGNHLFQFGGIYQRNWDYHQRTDNGGGINYYPTYQLGDSSGAGNVDMTALGLPNKTLNREAAAILGIVTESQQAYTRTGASLTLNPPLTPAFDQSTIPFYNVYFSDSWHMKPTFTLTYGLGWTLEMPPTEQNGKQVEFVDASDQPIDIQSYIAQRQRAALQGQVYNPTVGFALIGNTGNSPKYPYDPFYGSFSPRVAAAWNPHFSGDSWMSKIFGEDKTVLRGGYGRIYGRLNGVNLVLVPLLGTGLIQAVQCTKVLANGNCGPGTPTAGPGANAAFRIGIDGNVAPLQAATPTLPQPDFPGINAAAAGATQSLDPHFRPNVVDSFDLTLQRQVSNRITVEAGYIGRIIHHEYQPIDTNMVPYMMTLGGQSFVQAYDNIEIAMGCNISEAKCLSSGIPTVAPQPFFETALAGTGYCTPGNCTATVIKNEFTNFQTQGVWSLWSDLDQGGIKGGPGGTTVPGFNFPCSMESCALNTPLGSAGQLTSGNGANASIGHGNYNAGFLTVRMSDWRGLTAQSNLTFSKALGTGALVQSTSGLTADDPFNLDLNYGPQPFDRRWVYNSFLVYQPPFYKNQQGIVGHLLGGWNFSPIFTAGSGEPLTCTTQTGGQSFGSADAVDFAPLENCQFSSYNAGHGTHFNVPTTGVDADQETIANNVAQSVNGTNVSVNMFSNPLGVWNSVRPPILGLDKRDGGFGPITGLPYWNLDMSIKKDFRITERFSTQFQAVITNILNHDVFLDPTLSLASPGQWGVLTTQGNTPRSFEFGLRVAW